MSNTPTQRLDARDRETPALGPLARLGDYELGERLAVGGMAEIYLAHKAGVLGFRKPLVIKRMRRELANDPEFTKMFVDEARICATLTHTNIVSVFDLGEVEGQLFIAMEYVEGVDCSRLQESVSPLPYEASVAICIAALRGLHHAHGLQVIHRDISPHNILVGVDGAVKVTDFGIARAAERLTHTMPGVLKGKLAYMSPEQASAMPLDRRSDLFAMALTGYEMLAGRRAYDSRDQSLLSLVRQARVTPLSEVNSDVPKRVSAVFARALAASPEDRYASCAQFADALSLACQGWVEPAPPETLGRLARGALGGVNETFVVQVKKKKSRRALAWIAGALLLAALAGGAAAFWPTATVEEPLIAATLPVAEPPLPEPDVVEPPPVVKEPPVAERGYLTLSSGPWANVFIGARKIGVTPFHKVPLPAGKHRVRLESPGLKQTKEIVVDVEPGKTVTRIVWFDR